MVARVGDIKRAAQSVVVMCSRGSWPFREARWLGAHAPQQTGREPREEAPPPPTGTLDVYDSANF